MPRSSSPPPQHRGDSFSYSPFALLLLFCAIVHSSCLRVYFCSSNHLCTSPLSNLLCVPPSMRAGGGGGGGSSMASSPLSFRAMSGMFYVYLPLQWSGISHRLQLNLQDMADTFASSSTCMLAWLTSTSFDLCRPGLSDWCIKQSDAAQSTFPVCTATQGRLKQRLSPVAGLLLDILQSSQTRTAQTSKHGARANEKPFWRHDPANAFVMTVPGAQWGTAPLFLHGICQQLKAVECF